MRRPLFQDDQLIAFLVDQHRYNILEKRSAYKVELPAEIFYCTQRAYLSRTEQFFNIVRDRFHVFTLVLIHIG